MIELNRVIVKPYDKDKFEVYKTYKTILYDDDFKLKVIVPKGYITNGADIPRIFWSIYPPYRSEYFSAVVVHDYLCDKAQTREDYKIADKALRAGMRMLGVNNLTISIFYYSCRLFHSIKIYN